MVLGSLAVFVASLASGITGFGYALLATPLLLLLHFPLAAVVTINLCVGLLTRLPVAYHLRHHVNRQRTTQMSLGCVPGTLLGAAALARLDPHLLELAAGIVAMPGAIVLVRSRPATRAMPGTGASVVAGFTSGVLASATSLNGIPPALLLAHRGAEARTFVGDLAVYFVAGNAIALGALALEGQLSTHALGARLLLWTPGAALGTVVGAVISPRLPSLAFRRLVVATIFAMGLATVLRASLGGF